MGLDDRKMAILNAVIRTYLETGEPVGSRTISKMEGLSLSSATIRNEMSDLEDMGYLIQPHTSAGRIPSDMAYRLYVDTMMQTQVNEVNDIRDELLKKSDKLETLLQQVANLLAKNTNYTTMVSAPKYEHRKIKFIQLSEVDAEHLLIVFVLDNNVVRNRIIDLDEPVDKSEVFRLNILFNSFLAGTELENVNLQILPCEAQEKNLHRISAARPHPGSSTLHTDKEPGGKPPGSLLLYVSSSCPDNGQNREEQGQRWL